MAITVKIEQRDDDTIAVNGKIIRRDMEGRWSSHSVLCQAEKQMFHAFVQMQNERGNNHIQKATYQL